MTRHTPDRRTRVLCEHCGSSFLRDKNTHHCSDMCRFMGKVAASGDCWLWTATRGTDGYGQYRFGGRLIGAHRAAYLLLRGPIPDGLHLDHLCRTPACVNPKHLEAVSKWVNTLRGTAPTAVNAAKTHCDSGHKFTPDNTYIRPDGGGRQCRQCKRQRAAVAA